MCMKTYRFCYQVIPTVNYVKLNEASVVKTVKIKGFLERVLVPADIKKTYCYKEFAGGSQKDGGELLIFKRSKALICIYL